MFTLIAFFMSLFVQYLVIRVERKYAFFADSVAKLHAVHTTPTPRVGGVGIFIAFMLTTLYFLPQNWPLVVGGAVIFAFGLYEDWDGDTKKEARLAAMAIGSFIAVYFGGYVAADTEFFVIPYWPAVLFTIFAIVGLSSAMNFVDGLNGLAGGIGIITLVFFTILSIVYGDQVMSILTLITIGSLMGFLFWNYPFGKIFLGDGGAYFLGFVLAMLSIMLADRHGEISLWYPVVALSYPIIETFVTIDRRIKRKKKKGVPFFEAEKVHLHTLNYRRVTKKNHEASNTLLWFHFLINMMAFAFHSSVYMLIVLLFVSYVMYMHKYRKIIRFGRHNLLMCFECITRRLKLARRH